jgi:hypothetical protein
LSQLPASTFPGFASQLPAIVALMAAPDHFPRL